MSWNGPSQSLREEGPKTVELQYLGETNEAAQEMLVKAAAVLLSTTGTLHWRVLGTGHYLLRVVCEAPVPEAITRQLEALDWVKYVQIDAARLK